MNEQKTFDFLTENFEMVTIDNGQNTVITSKGIYNVTTFENDNYYTVMKDDQDVVNFKELNELLNYIN
ncbi:hypothetical protein [Mammaliicoccus sp. A-M4]|uniref:hypothetical protein n=1 Tax=Mammaliicoccus sp. A-M4 TaxID=2898664 RepID=UPI001EFB83E9|nr:hypothetical protein [Mammaliicoccus sp. A-M4]